MEITQINMIFYQKSDLHTYVVSYVEGRDHRPQYGRPVLSGLAGGRLPLASPSLVSVSRTPDSGVSQSILKLGEILCF